METISIKSRTDFYKLFSTIDRTLGITITLVIDMKFLEPIDILVLTQFSIFWEQNNGSILLEITNESTNTYLNSIGFVDFVSSNTHQAHTIDGIPSYSAMPIRRVEQATMNEYINATEKYFNFICGNKDLTMLNLCMSELINNVYDHSHSPIGAYIFCQYYPQNNMIKMAVSDLGIGIPKSVNTYKLKNGEPIISDIDCVKWAIKENKTTQSIPQNMGKGLDTVNTFIRKNKSSWKLYSDEVLLKGYASGNNYLKNPIYGFKGTIVQVNISISNLPDKELVNDFVWNI